jgi:hypothetical protein
MQLFPAAYAVLPAGRRLKDLWLEIGGVAPFAPPLVLDR